MHTDSRSQQTHPVLHHLQRRELIIVGCHCDNSIIVNKEYRNVKQQFKSSREATLVS
jgi:hypothetical protein